MRSSFPWQTLKTPEMGGLNTFFYRDIANLCSNLVYQYDISKSSDGAAVEESTFCMRTLSLFLKKQPLLVRRIEDLKREGQYDLQLLPKWFPCFRFVTWE